MTVVYLVDGEPVDFETYVSAAIERKKTRDFENALSTIVLRQKREQRTA